MRVLTLVALGIPISAVAILSLAWGITYNWPDFQHTNYGFPLVWATHTLSTIVGPVDRWNVDISKLVLDLFIWLGMLVAAMTIVANYIRK